ncbi:hypothetical protein HK100_009807, partial [Physocladia obscura]
LEPESESDDDDDLEAEDIENQKLDFPYGEDDVDLNESDDEVDNFGEDLYDETNDDDNERDRKRKKASSTTFLTDDDEEDDNGDNSDNNGVAIRSAAVSKNSRSATASKRRKSMESRRKRNKYLSILTEYYEEGSYYGMSASQIVYMMLNQVGKVTGDALWFSIIALTDQYLHDRIDPRLYKASVTSFQEDSTKFDLTGGAVGNGFDENENQLNDDDDNDGDDFGTPRLAPQLNLANGGGRASSRPRFSAAGIGQYGAKSAADRSIRYSDEFSQYVAARLGTWREKGRQKLTNMLARMGLPQVQTHQPYSEMKISIQKELKTKLINIGPAYNMTNLQFPSFVRQNGYKIAVSASDCVHAILAMLDCGAGWMRRHAVGGDVDESVHDAKVGDGGGSSNRLHGSASLAAKIAAAAAAKLTGTGIGTRLGVGAVAVKISEFDDVVAGGLVEGFEVPVPDEDEGEK